MRRMSDQRDRAEDFDDLPWDEQRWELFIRRQEARADEYLAMLDYYGDEPASHNLIARSMGWTHLVTNCDDEPEPQRCLSCPQSRRAACQFFEAYGEQIDDDLDDIELGESATAPPAVAFEPDLPDPGQMAEDLAQAEWNIRYAQHPINRHAHDLLLRLHELCKRLGEQPELADSPLNLLLHHAHRCAGKIAGSLRGYTEPEMLGMVVAYLKISYHAACVALGHVDAAVSDHPPLADAAAELTNRLRTIRRQLGDLIAEFRSRLGRVLGSSQSLN